MRNKISATLALVALLVGESWAVNHVELVATGPGVNPPDSAGITNNIEINTPLTLNLIITNDVPYTGASLGWTIYSPDGSISTVTQNGVQSIPPWDITSFDFFQTNHFRSWDGILPDSVQTTGFSMVSNFPVSVGANFLDINLMLTHQGVFCIDSARVSAAGEWLVIAQGGAEIAPTWGGGANGYCFKTFTSGPNLPCTFDNPPSQAIIPLPGDPTVSVDFDAIDPDGPSPCVFSIVSGPGAINSATGLFSIDTADFFPGDTAALTVVRVEDQAAAGTNHNLTTIINDTTFRGEVRLEVRAEDGHGADTLFVNQPGKIHAVYSSNRPTFAMEMQFSIASSPGPGTQYLTLREGDMVFDTGAEPFNLKLYDPRFQNGTSPDTARLLGVVLPPAPFPPPGSGIHLGYFTVTPTSQGALVFDTVWGIVGGTMLVAEGSGFEMSARDSLVFSFPSVVVVCPGATTQDFTDIDCDGVLNVFDNCPTVFNPGQEEFDTTAGFGNACFMPQYLTPMVVVARESLGGLPDSIGTDPQVNLRVRDPDGFSIGHDSINVFTNEIGDSASYFQLNGSDSVVINNPKSGVYVIEAFAQLAPGLGSRALAPRYTIGVRTDGTVEHVFGPFVNPITSPLRRSIVFSAEDRDIIDTLDFETAPYVFGSANGDEKVNIADITYLIARIFAGGPAPIPDASGDVNCDFKIANIADVTFLIQRIFTGGPAPGCI